VSLQGPLITRHFMRIRLSSTLAAVCPPRSSRLHLTRSRPAAVSRARDLQDRRATEGYATCAIEAPLSTPPHGELRAMANKAWAVMEIGIMDIKMFAESVRY
jgi:hypothetical protein